MPFVSKEHREENHKPCCVGDLCYLEYKKLVNEFRKNRRWSTIHQLTKDLFWFKNDETTAKFLAWAVFFCKEAMKYEDEKEKENGTI